MRIQHDKAAIVNVDAHGIAVADMDCPVGMPVCSGAFGKIRASSCRGFSSKHTVHDIRLTGDRGVSVFSDANQIPIGAQEQAALADDRRGIGAAVIVFELVVS